jgi:hypothetical protein
MPSYDFPDFQYYEEILSVLKKQRKKFEIPISQPTENLYFPSFLAGRLHSYLYFYQEHLKGLIDDKSPYDGSGMEYLHSSISELIEGIIKAVNSYYDGDLRNASEVFDTALEKVLFTKNIVVSTVEATTRLYRARFSRGGRMKRQDLFHNPFENRHAVATSRYSIPGLPALYLGDSVYVCWEEFNQPPLRDLYFSQFRLNRDLKVVKIQRLGDLLAMLNDSSVVHNNLFTPYGKMTYLLRYLEVVG